MLSVLFRRNFALLWSAGTVSLLGDWVLFAALPYYIYEQTGSSLATGAMFAASTLPRVLFGSVAGVFVDRWDRKHTMIASDLLRAALLLLLLGVPSGGVWLIYVVAFAETTVSLFFGPAKAAVTPRLAGGKEHLLAANALNGLSENLSRLLGPFVGGALLAASGLTVVVLADIASYVLSALLMTLIAIPRDLAGKAQTIADVPAAIVAAGRRWQRFQMEWLEGLALLWRDSWLTLFFGIAGMATIAQGIVNAMLVVFVREVLGGDAQTFAWLLSAQGVGGLIGGFALGHLGHRLPAGRLLGLSLGMVGSIFLAIVNVPVLPVDLALLAAVGVPVMGWIVATSTLLQTCVTDRYRGRIVGAYSTSQAILMVLGMALAGLLGHFVGVVALLRGAGALLLAAGLLALRLSPAREAAEPEPAAAPSPLADRATLSKVN